MLEFLWNSNIVGFVLGAAATFFVVKNNLARAQKAWIEADTYYQEAVALKVKAQDLLDKLKGRA